MVAQEEQTTTTTTTYDYAYYQQYLMSLMTLDYLFTGIVYIFILLLLVKGCLMLWKSMKKKDTQGTSGGENPAADTTKVVP